MCEDASLFNCFEQLNEFQSNDSRVEYNTAKPKPRNREQLSLHPVTASALARRRKDRINNKDE